MSFTEKGKPILDPKKGNETLEANQCVRRKPEGVKVSTNCNHEVWVEDGKVYMANADDGWYVQEFSSASQIDAFIKILKSARDECFPTMRAVDPPSALVGGDNSENSAGN